MRELAKIRKAIVAGIGAGFFAGVTGLSVSMADGNLTGPELVIAAGLALGGLSAVGAATYGIKNAE